MFANLLRGQNRQIFYISASLLRARGAQTRSIKGLVKDEGSGIVALKDFAVPKKVSEFTLEACRDLFKSGTVKFPLDPKLTEIWSEELKKILADGKNQDFATACQLLRQGDIDVVNGSFDSKFNEEVKQEELNFKPESDFLINIDSDSLLKSFELHVLFSAILGKNFQNQHGFFRSIKDRDEKGLMLPPHTDFSSNLANDLNPAKYLLMFCAVGRGEVRTLVISAQRVFEGLSEGVKKILTQKVFYYCENSETPLEQKELLEKYKNRRFAIFKIERGQITAELGAMSNIYLDPSCGITQTEFKFAISELKMTLLTQMCTGKNLGTYLEKNDFLVARNDKNFHARDDAIHSVRKEEVARNTSNLKGRKLVVSSFSPISTSVKSKYPFK